tara:strand:- start:4062 stop:4457 length:396 start_codon:yes stop_codon:yes gene_type:complete
MEQLIEKFTKEINDKFFYFEETINYLKNKIQSLIDEFHNERKELKEENDKLREEITSYQYQNFSYEQILRNPEEKKNSYIFCIICDENNRNVLFKPCNHLLICDTCSANHHFDTCTICRTNIESLEYAYLV